MKRLSGICFISICLILCLLPFAGMRVAETTTTTENKTLASFPELFSEEGTLNLDFFEELSEYFEDHFAFRELLVNIDSLIQSQVFGVSNVSTVIVGEDGWLYYTATLDDYLGQNLLSERSVYGAAYNLLLTQTYVEQQGATFAVTIAPNKNSLYGEYMPYYASVKVSEESNVERLVAVLEELGVNYIDLYAVFEGEDEILYLLRDSHWNGKGAMLVYREIMAALGLSESLSSSSYTLAETEVGDLNTMIYPLTAVAEWNYYYEYATLYTYITRTSSVEEAWIATSNEEAEGTLLMFRDSFGNSLLPLLANSFGTAYFSKGEPFGIGLYMQLYQPDVVLIEKVERNLSIFAENPPVVQGICVMLPEAEAIVEGGATCEVGVSPNFLTYWRIEGVVEESLVETASRIYVRITAGDVEETFAAFLLTTEETDCGYLLYLTMDYVTQTFSPEENEVTLSVLVETSETLWEVYCGVVFFTE